MVLLALVIVSFKVSDFGRMILKTLQNADSDIWPWAWETFWTTASKGKKSPRIIFLWNKNTFRWTAQLCTQDMATYPVKGELSKMSNFVHFRHVFTLKLQICANPCLVQVSSLSSKASKTLQSNVRMFLCQKMIECLFSSHIHTHAQEESELNGISWWGRKGLVSRSRMVKENCLFLHKIRYVVKYIVFYFVFKCVDCFWYLTCWCRT